MKLVNSGGVLLQEEKKRLSKRQRTPAPVNRYEGELLVGMSGWLLRQGWLIIPERKVYAVGWLNNMDEVDEDTTGLKTLGVG